MKNDWDSIPEKLWPFVAHHVEFKNRSKTQWSGTAPWDAKKGKFYANPDTGQWDQKSSGEAGNTHQFLARASQNYREHFTDIRLMALAKSRGLPIISFHPWQVGWDKVTRCYTFPYVSEKGTIHDIRRWSMKKKGIFGTKGCPTQLYGTWQFREIRNPRILWLREGEADAIALRQYLRLIGHRKDNVLALPGVMSFKDAWLRYFAGRHVRLGFDHDQPGRDGTKKAIVKLRESTAALEGLTWPKGTPNGYDVRDFVVEQLGSGLSKPAKRKVLDGMFKPVKKDFGPLVVPAALNSDSDEPLPTFDETVAVYKQNMLMNEDLVDALRVIFAVTLSTAVPGDPLWVYIVGPSGGGKTMLLTSLAASPRALVISTLSPKALVSGHRTEPDPSLLPKLNGRCAVFKDFTEVLSMHSVDKDFIWGTLRGAYDGSVYKPYGHGVVRDYKSLHFSLLAGVTPKIHADNKSSLGERFLKYCIRSQSSGRERAQILAAMNNVAKEQQIDQDLRNAGGAFLARDIDPENLPPVPNHITEQIASLSQLVGKLRGQVDREAWGEREVLYRPQSEVATRLAKQLVKLAMMLAIVDGVSEVGYLQFKLVKRIAFDTAVGFHIDVVDAIAGLGGSATRREIHDLTQIANSTLQRRLDDLRMMDVLKKEENKGKSNHKAPIASHLWVLNHEVVDLMKAVNEESPPRVHSSLKKQSKRRPGAK